MKALEELWKKGCDFLGTSYAILGGAMTWISERHLVSAISNNGAFGVLACGAMTSDLLNEEIKQTQHRTNKPFGVNLITMHPALSDLIQVCINNSIRHVVLAGGVPTTSAIHTLRDGGIKVICFAPTLALGKKLIKNGVDALIIEGMEAGGHIGTVSTSVLVQEILPHIRDTPIFVAGGIGRGEKIRSYLEMGAAGCQLGTRFVCAKESIAHPRFKQAFINANARDAVSSVQLDAQFPIIPVRSITNQGTKKFLELQQQIIQQFNAGQIDKKAAQLTLEHYWAGALRRAVIEGDIEYGSLMAGQSVGMVEKEQSVKEILEELYRQAQYLP